MKFKTRLIVAFCIISILPVILFAGISSTFLYAQWRSAIKDYHLDSGNAGLTSTPFRVVTMITEQLKTRILEEVNEKPENFLDEEYLNRLNDEFEYKNSYLVVKLENELLYNGSGHDHMNIVNAAFKNEYKDMYTFGQNYGEVYEQVDLKLSDGKTGSAYVFTKLDETIPEMRNLIILIFITVLLILVLTGFIMVYWIHRSMIRPVNAMRCATQNIRDGNLDFDMEISSDEMGELASDIDELKNRLKDNAQEKVKQDELNRQLISNISHDLKTPITTIKGYAEGLLDGVAASPEKQKQYLQTIVSKADDMTRLIEELTLYTKFDVNSIPYNFEELDAKDFFDDCEIDYQNELEAEGIDFSYSNFAPAGIKIKADVEQLKRVMNNIVGNSVKYMNKKQRRIALRVNLNDDMLGVEIEDNGCGMDAEDLPKIFDRFYRTDASRHGPQNGSGIGLAIVKKIVTEHGGRVWATSKVNIGTIMHMEFPVIKEEKNEK